MKVLFVTGDEFAAMEFDRKFNRKEVLAELEVGKEKHLEDDDGNEYHVKILEFGEVDPAFVTFMRRDMIDYDDSKHSDFFILEEEEVKEKEPKKRTKKQELLPVGRLVHVETVEGIDIITLEGKETTHVVKGHTEDRVMLRKIGDITEKESEAFDVRYLVTNDTGGYHNRTYEFRGCTE